MSPETIDKLWFAFILCCTGLGGFAFGFIIGESRRLAAHTRHKSDPVCSHGDDWDQCPVCRH